jgi:hypothetical protein
MLIICFASCFEMWNVIEKCDFSFLLLQRVFLWICFRDHVWSFHRLCFDCSTRVFSRWKKLDKATHQTRRKRFIKFDENDSSNLIRAIFHQIWLDDFLSNLTDDISSNVINCISSNLINDISSDLMSDISSNFEKKRQFLYFLISDFMHRHIIWRT